MIRRVSCGTSPASGRAGGIKHETQSIPHNNGVLQPTLWHNAMNRKQFYDGIRGELFPNGLTQLQVERIDSILDAWEATDYTDLRWLAYALGTAYHESMRFTTYKEKGGRDYFTRLYDITGNPRKARDLGNDQIGDGATYCGRGPDQLTGKANYRKESALCGLDLVANPDLAADNQLAASRLLRNMASGLYRRHRLADYFNESAENWVDARNIINAGHDKAELIAGYAMQFWHALQQAELNPVTAPQTVNAEQPVLPKLDTPTNMPDQRWHSGWKTHIYMLGCVALGIAGLMGYVPGLSHDASAQLIEQGLAISGIRSAFAPILTYALTTYLRGKNERTSIPE